MNELIYWIVIAFAAGWALKKTKEDIDNGKP